MLPLGYKEINEMADKINAPQCIVARGVRLFEETHEAPILQHRSIAASAAACLYIACRLEKAPRTFKEICAVSSISRKELGNCFLRIVKVNQMSIGRITTNDFIPRFCAKLGLPSKVHRWASHIARKATEIGLVAGRNPISVAAAAIFVASQGSDSRKTVKEICGISGVSGSTIRHLYRLMCPYAKELFPENVKDSATLHDMPRHHEAYG
ncbi:transcription initiation factor IIB-like [Anopheles cruzii]|uniref:transcription initiation factor IIB-like n=1 Tax=Anopheles cruzii TaxID=68878 RepID=UPI0022EC52C3|nr:transcription initiation factor IIB-like [Anopheles cruzii]